jgi:F-type H+-transporting ATPase subunit k
MATLGITGVVGYLSVGGSKKTGDNQPPINAKSKEEESFVKYVASSSRHGQPQPHPSAINHG